MSWSKNKHETFNCCVYCKALNFSSLLQVNPFHCKRSEILLAVFNHQLSWIAEARNRGNHDCEVLELVMRNNIIDGSRIRLPTTHVKTRKLLQVCKQVVTRFLPSQYQDVFALLVPSCCDKSGTTCKLL
jgi:hypothetical protein